MKTRIFLGIAGFLCMTASVAWGQAAQGDLVKLRYVFTKGQQFRLAYNEKNSDSDENLIESSRSVSGLDKEMSMLLDVTDVSPNGDAVINTRYEYLRFAITKDGVTIGMDTRKEVNEVNPALAQMEQLKPVLDVLEDRRKLINRVFIGLPFRLYITNQGKVTDIKGMDVIWDKYREEVGKFTTDAIKRAELDMLIEGFFGEDSAKKLFSSILFIPFPLEAVRKGQEWSDQYEFEVGSIHLGVKRKFRLESDPHANQPLRLSGTQQFDTPPKTAEIEIVLPRSDLNLEIYVDAKKGTLLSVHYAGRVEFEIYALIPNATRQLAMRSASDIEGNVTMTPLSK